MGRMISRLEALERKRIRCTGPQLTLILTFTDGDKLAEAEQQSRRLQPSRVKLAFKLREAPPCQA